ncbi:hypothetical protein K6K41_05395 [Chenggangzhangella methanolivorans]|uniref:Uncharacterized protein n=1 Tax=Chenggangzhangella methanolivorans TaxID=1437009 RepID=A0A9E6RAY9_9HYPH|nr:hypothetical protein K6K41_05395 [Chenggangzhangella methanolivorans]
MGVPVRQQMAEPPNSVERSRRSRQRGLWSKRIERDSTLIFSALASRARLAGSA